MRNRFINLSVQHYQSDKNSKVDPLPAIPRKPKSPSPQSDPSPSSNLVGTAASGLAEDVLIASSPNPSIRLSSSSVPTTSRSDQFHADNSSIEPSRDVNLLDTLIYTNPENNKLCSSEELSSQTPFDSFACQSGLKFSAVAAASGFNSNLGAAAQGSNHSQCSKNVIRQDDSDAVVHELLELSDCVGEADRCVEMLVEKPEMSDACVEKPVDVSGGSRRRLKKRHFEDETSDEEGGAVTKVECISVDVEDCGGVSVAKSTERSRSRASVASEGERKQRGTCSGMGEKKVKSGHKLPKQHNAATMPEEANVMPCDLHARKSRSPNGLEEDAVGEDVSGGATIHTGSSTRYEIATAGLCNGETNEERRVLKGGDTERACSRQSDSDSFSAHCDASSTISGHTTSVLLTKYSNSGGIAQSFSGGIAQSFSAAASTLSSTSASVAVPRGVSAGHVTTSASHSSHGVGEGSEEQKGWNRLGRLSSLYNESQPTMRTPGRSTPASPSGRGQADSPKKTRSKKASNAPASPPNAQASSHTISSSSSSVAAPRKSPKVQSKHAASSPRSSASGANSVGMSEGSVLVVKKMAGSVTSFTAPSSSASAPSTPVCSDAVSATAAKGVGLLLYKSVSQASDTIIPDNSSSGSDSEEDEAASEALMQCLDLSTKMEDEIVERLGGSTEEGRDEVRRHIGNGRCCVYRSRNWPGEFAGNPDWVNDVQKPEPRKDGCSTSSEAAPELKEYQKAGMQWLMALHVNDRNGILADEMGLGKTAQTCSFLNHLYTSGMLGVQTTIISAPASLLDNWIVELRKWAPDLRAVKYHGRQTDRREMAFDILNRYARAKEDEKEAAESPSSPGSASRRSRATSQRSGTGSPGMRSSADSGGASSDASGEGDPYDVIVTSMQTLTNKWDEQYLRELRPVAYLVVDEAHSLKNKDALTYRKLNKLVRSDRRLLLTGSPIQNRTSELRNLVQFVMPQVFGSTTIDLALECYSRQQRRLARAAKREERKMAVERLALKNAQKGEADGPTEKVIGDETMGQNNGDVGGKDVLINVDEDPELTAQPIDEKDDANRGEIVKEDSKEEKKLEGEDGGDIRTDTEIKTEGREQTTCQQPLADVEVATPDKIRRSCSPHSRITSDNSTALQPQTPSLLDRMTKMKAGGVDGPRLAPDVECLQKLLSPFILRRLKCEVLGDLPKKVNVIVRCAMEGRQKDLYVNEIHHKQTHLAKNLSQLTGQLVGGSVEGGGRTGRKGGGKGGRPKGGAAVAGMANAVSKKGEEGETVGGGDEVAPKEAKEETGAGSKTKFVNSLLSRLRRICNHPMLMQGFYTEEQVQRLIDYHCRSVDGFRGNPRHKVEEELRKWSDYEMHQQASCVPGLTWARIPPSVLLESAKIRELMKIVASLQATQSKGLVFTQFTTFLDVIGEALYTHIPSLN
eukprot:GHVS01091577.1.p1 GENE.GHVS01091577.1~~GHVS01091577.1.p1  ORF type:complete len:1426 (+),score=210.87 GHVS01091577.1:226-4503(+)